MTNYRRLPAENTRCVVNSLVFLVTMFVHDDTSLHARYCSSGYTQHSGCQKEVF